MSDNVKPNATDAKDIALYFLKETGVERMTSQIVAKTVIQAKSLLSAGYKKDEIIMVIDKIISKGVHMYSLGYVSSAINDVLREIKDEQKEEKDKQIKQNLRQQIDKEMQNRRTEVDEDDERAERNRQKAGKLGVQSRKREKFNFDMFKE